MPQTKAGWLAKRQARAAQIAKTYIDPNGSPREQRAQARENAKIKKAEKAALIARNDPNHWTTKAAVQRCRFHPDSQGQPNTLSRAVSSTSSTSDATATEVSTLTEPASQESDAASTKKKKKKKKKNKKRKQKRKSFAFLSVRLDELEAKVAKSNQKTGLKHTQLEQRLFAVEDTTLDNRHEIRQQQQANKDDQDRMLELINRNPSSQANRSTLAGFDLTDRAYVCATIASELDHSSLLHTGQSFENFLKITECNTELSKEHGNQLHDLQNLHDQTAAQLSQVSSQLEALKAATLVPCSNVAHPGHPDHPEQQTPIKQEPLDSV